MWLVTRDTNGLGKRFALPPALRAALVRWYTGSGSQDDHAASVSMVVTARENHKWIACDCLGDEARPPIMSPAYLSFQETYYLRRLTSRPPHKRSCPFYLPPAPDRIRERADDTLFEIEFPKGLFNAHKEAPEKLAQAPLDSEPDDRSRGVDIPRLARLLWMLLEAARTNVIQGLPSEGRPEFSIRDEMRKVWKAAQRFEIAPGICLADHLYTKATDYESLRVHARLREAAKKWPVGFAPQAFMLLEANAITGTDIETGLGTVTVRNRIQHTGIVRAQVEPPFLALVVVGEHSKREGYLPLRAYAQPVFKGNQFIPSDRADDRQLLERLTRFQYRMRAKGVQVAIKKPLFDIFHPSGNVRPDLVVAYMDWRTGEEADFAVQVLRETTSHYLERKLIERERIIEIRPALTITLDDIATDAILDKLEAMID
ncbi:hypothetical protein PK98_14475 [Croceibacterium mercuriale]|uniref:DUF1173 domain-containing protein n=1 Tax=Croceibacterium mercuriale TaxID=1572751 RepID=A0A0B2BW89_9SPHN|nr:hypothetical protein [Croceibacterium mercuriale]KHL24202.1 hypothetical protein PK98_14475 [Croceibacterium mercuriale]